MSPDELMFKGCIHLGLSRPQETGGFLWFENCWKHLGRCKNTTHQHVQQTWSRFDTFYSRFLRYLTFKMPQSCSFMFKRGLKTKERLKYKKWTWIWGETDSVQVRLSVHVTKMFCCLNISTKTQWRPQNQRFVSFMISLRIYQQLIIRLIFPNLRSELSCSLRKFVGDCFQRRIDPLLVSGECLWRRNMIRRSVETSLFVWGLLTIIKMSTVIRFKVKVQIEFRQQVVSSDRAGSLANHACYIHLLPWQQPPSTHTHTHTLWLTPQTLNCRPFTPPDVWPRAGVPPHNAPVHVHTCLRPAPDDSVSECVPPPAALPLVGQRGASGLVEGFLGPWQ